MNDLISRQNVLRCLTDISYNQCKTQGEADVIDTAKTMVAVMPSAQSEPCEDAISRQAAIDALDVLCQEHRYKIPGKRETYSQYNEAWQDALDRAEGAIFNLPSAQPEIIRCMDCKYYTLKPGPNSVNCYVKHCTRSARVSTSPDDYCSRGERRTDGCR